MKQLAAWLYAHNYLSHALVALGAMALVAAPLALVGIVNAHWIGAAWGAALYAGREKRDAEMHSGLPGSEAWKVGVVFPVGYDTDGQLDFLAPFGACMGAGALVELALRFL